jgi:hypothetical protein
MAQTLTTGIDVDNPTQESRKPSIGPVAAAAGVMGAAALGSAAGKKLSRGAQLQSLRSLRNKASHSKLRGRRGLTGPIGEGYRKSVDKAEGKVMNAAKNKFMRRGGFAGGVLGLGAAAKGAQKMKEGTLDKESSFNMEEGATNMAAGGAAGLLAGGLAAFLYSKGKARGAQAAAMGQYRRTHMGPVIRAMEKNKIHADSHRRVAQAFKDRGDMNYVFHHGKKAIHHDYASKMDLEDFHRATQLAGEDGVRDMVQKALVNSSLMGMSIGGLAGALSGYEKTASRYKGQK